VWLFILRNHPPDAGDYKVILDSVCDTGALNCKMAVWKNSSNGNVVLAIKGTDPTSFNDGVQDISMVLGGVGSIAVVQPTLNIARNLVEKFGVNMVTGHSLGGYITEIVATNGCLPGIAFCAPGSNGPIVKLGGNVVKGFHNVNFENDVLGNVMAGVYQHVQWSVYVKCEGYTHGISYMVEEFKGKQHITNANVEARSTSYPTGWYYPA
jgi:hypothetical protein